ncbi:hypothetical protein [Leptospira noguchii]|uniref:hypothetical protein n=1 Tax=Leptospira noguchii TaxID=28182 RepID=UPI0002BFDBA9|nr:hypothetical protein [Leptospira noguchii]EMI61849.1 hypothetical protein LEP1GSC072_1822 [Leptospira noguchii str. Bonito]EMS81812.1 hypothetical protein LEP1GSC073_1588 [Leptospira noguchii str. Cascata]EMS86785.1 hypothetical protein LEP1GSC073_1062 [Leptospira noguchii str. Cascata]
MSNIQKYSGKNNRVVEKSVSVVWKRSIEAVLLMPLWNFLTTLIEVFLESLFYSEKVK